MTELTLKEVRPVLPFNINYNMSDIELHPNRIEESQFDFEVFLPTKNMNLQRPLVWTELQKEQLIYSIFKGIKLPPISVLKTYKDINSYKLKDYIYEVIDGKQRLTTLFDFINNRFSINWNNNQYFFKDLHSYLKSEFYHCITSNIGYNYPEDKISDENKIKWFEMINFTGTIQDKTHLENLRNA